MLTTFATTFLCQLLHTALSVLAVSPVSYDLNINRVSCIPISTPHFPQLTSQFSKLCLTYGGAYYALHITVIEHLNVSLIVKGVYVADGTEKHT